MTPRLLAAALAALLVGSAAHAAGALLEGRVSHVEAEGLGPTAADGVVLESYYDGGAFGGVAVESPHMRVEIDRRAQEAAMPFPLPEQLESEHRTIFVYEGPAVIRSTEFRPALRLEVHGSQAPATYTADAIEAAAKANGKTVRSVTGATVRDPPETSLDGAFLVDEPQGELDVHGDFLLSAWRVNFTIETPDGDIHIWTGERRSPHHNVSSPVGYGDRYEKQQAFIFVEGGNMTAPMYPGAQLYLWNSTTEVRGSATASGGELAMPTTVQGPVMMQLQGFDDALDVKFDDIPAPMPAPAAGKGQGLDGKPADGAADTSPLTVVQEVPVPQWAWIGLLLLAAAVPVVIVLRRLRERHQWHRLEYATDFGLHDEVVQRSQRFLSHRRHGPLAATMHAYALLHSAGPDAADEFLSQASVDESARRYLAACIRSSQGRWPEASLEMQACLEIEPAFRLEIMRNPLLKDLLRDDHEGYA